MKPKRSQFKTPRTNNVSCSNDRLRSKELNKSILSSQSAYGWETLSKGRGHQLTRKRRTRYLNRVAVRLSNEAPIPLKEVIGELEKRVIVHVLDEVDGNQKDAAKILGMKCTTLNEKLKRYGVRVKRIAMILLSVLFFYISSLSMVKAGGANGARLEEKRPELPRNIVSALSKTHRKNKPICRALGKTDIRLPVVNMGVMNATNPDLVKRSYKKRVRYFDTAARHQNGLNEAMVGQALQEPGVRDRVVIGTKVYVPPSAILQNSH